MTAYAEAILLSIAPFLFFRSRSESRCASMSNSTWTVALPDKSFFTRSGFRGLGTSEFTFVKPDRHTVAPQSLTPPVLVGQRSPSIGLFLHRKRKTELISGEWIFHSRQEVRLSEVLASRVLLKKADSVGLLVGLPTRNKFSGTRDSDRHENPLQRFRVAAA